MLELLVHWLLAAVLIVLTANLVPGFKLKSFPAAMLAALIIGLVNSSIWYVLVFLTFPLTFITFGLFLFIVNGICLKLSAALTPGFTIVGFLPAVWGSMVLTILGWLVRFVFFPPGQV